MAPPASGLLPAGPHPIGPCLPTPAGALGAEALAHVEAHLLSCLDLLEDDDLERALAREHSAAVAARAALRPRAPDLSDLFDGPPPDLRLPDGSRLIGLPGGGGRLLDAAGHELRRLSPDAVGPLLARAGLHAPGLAARVAAWAQGAMDPAAALAGWARHPRATLPCGPDRAVQLDELRAPGGWPRAALLYESADLPDALPPLLLEGAAALDQLDRARSALTDPPLHAAEAELRAQLLRGPALTTLLPSAPELRAAWTEPEPLIAALPTWATLPAAALRVPDAGHLHLELLRAGEPSELPSDTLFSEAGLRVMARLHPGTPVAAWAWRDDAGRARARFELAVRGPGGWRFCPKPWRAFAAADAG